MACVQNRSFLEGCQKFRCHSARPVHAVSAVEKLALPDFFTYGGRTKYIVCLNGYAGCYVS